MNLCDEYQNFLIFISLLVKVRRQTFDSSHHIDLQRPRWAMVLIAVLGTKL